MRVAPFVVILLSGCAGLDSDACRRADWYELGFRDAIFRIQRQDDVYAQQCERHGLKIDAARYVQGWQEGKYESDQRAVSAHD